MSRVVIVTGAASGIGHAIVNRFLKDGDTVFALDVDGPALQAAQLRSWAPADMRVRPVQADVAEPAAVAAAVDQVMQVHGRIDVLVNNAGITGGPQALRLHETSVADFDHVWGVNVRGMFLMCRQCLPVMIAQGAGAIVNIASVAGLVAFPARAAYSVTKGAAVMLTRSLAVDYAALGIRCNAVCPGMIDTPMTHWRLQQPELLAQVVARIPQGAVGDVDDVASAVAFLASAEASYCNGSALVVDGGYSSV
ncbi:SDR family NAD(P)-dependent oxidoreductase [Thiomonas sp. FB-Cd]|uniref:SDR family NAD(P)-dependent oxidoreductase n=1 Tax=Thiomonas sp. FB-Cd TaxID=1158292 RepID=UPI0004DFAD76|nr:SDR family oxidoreductase [Thiomonas sp. FB-Cd]